MRTVSKRGLTLVAAALMASSAAGYATAADDAAARDARWSELSQSVYGDRKVEDTSDVVALDAPGRAEDAAIVPLTFKSAKPDQIKAMTLFIDENPSPVAAKFVFGPAGDPSQMNVRVRVNAYSNMRLVGETKDGKLLQNVRFVKASGGCSAPAGVSDEEAMQGAGEMRLKVTEPGKARLMIRHPMFTGMQMDPVSRAYTPARYINDLKVTYNDQTVFTLGGDISISANPVIEFGFKGDEKGVFKVTATDTDKQTWEKTFDAAGATN